MKNKQMKNESDNKKKKKIWKINQLWIYWDYTVTLNKKVMKH